MSNNVLSQSATELAVAGGAESEYDFAARARHIGDKKAKGTTRARCELNTNKLVSSLCADYRAHFAAVYGKTERLPSEVFEKIEKAVWDYQSSKMAEVNATNVINYRRAFYHKSKDMEVTERITLIGENRLSLEEQKMGIGLFIGAAEKRLKALEAKKTPNYEMEAKVKEQIMKLTATMQFIEGEISHQRKLTAETK